MPENEKNNENCLISLVIPVYNEAENVTDLAHEAVSVLEKAGYVFEVIFVDDASTDATLEKLRQLRGEDRRIRYLRHRLNCGQSAAVATGFSYAVGEWVATLDGDGQNDPADLPRMLERAEKEGGEGVTGIRTNRHDTRFRKLCSRVANGFRNLITGDRLVDSGCGARVVRRETLTEIPVFNGMHRFLPTLLRAQGWKILEEPVNHRSRLRGVSKYGVHNRLWRGIRDCFGVRWYRQRAFPADRVEGKTGGDSTLKPGAGGKHVDTTLENDDRKTQQLSAESTYAKLREKPRKNVYRLVLLLVIAVVIFCLYHYGPLHNPLHRVREMMESLEGGGVEVELYFFLTTVVLVAVGAPRLIFYMLGGLFFDFWEGLALALAGTLGGALLCFQVARWAGRDWTVRHFGNHLLYQKLVSIPSSVKSVFLTRQLPVSSVFLNIGLALSPVKPATFLLGSLLGFLPQGVIATLIGSGVGDDELLESMAEFITATLLLCALVFVSWRFAKNNKKRRIDINGDVGEGNEVASE